MTLRPRLRFPDGSGAGAGARNQGGLWSNRDRFVMEPQQSSTILERSDTERKSAMCEVFLLRDLGPFELSVHGDVRGSGSALAVSAVLDHLPFGSDIVVDLRRVASLDLDAAGAIARQIERRAAGDALVVALADDPWISRLLLGVGLDASQLLTTEEFARLSPVGRSLRLAS
jgi:hypothetical protein